MRGLALLFVLQCFVFGSAVFTENGIVYSGRVWDSEQDECVAVPAGRVPWIKYVRNSDYGWGEHTHRANLALAVNGYPGDPEEKRKMQLQLEVEVTKNLFWKNISAIHDNDLALFIHALLAVQKNPRDFHGTDLASELLDRVESKPRNGVVHPFLVLALCNSHLVDQHHLESLVRFTRHDPHAEHEIDGRQAELKALTLKAFACAANLDGNLHKYRGEMQNTAKCLVRRQNRVMDGSFGNVYTTSLAVQALIAAAPYLDRTITWNERQAFDFLLKEAYVKVNMIKAYYIEMALNAKDVTFIRQLYPGIPVPPPAGPPKYRHFIDYTIRNDLRTDYSFSINMKVFTEENFFQIMERASSLSDQFSFGYTSNNEGLPMVHIVAGTPNDAEENMFWRICRQRDIDHNRHVFKWINFRDSPVNLKPLEEEHIVFWYRNTECPRD